MNDDEEDYLLAIQDLEENYLYQERIHSRTFTKKFDWLNGTYQVPGLILTVTGLKSKNEASV